MRTYILWSAVKRTFAKLPYTNAANTDPIIASTENWLNMELYEKFAVQNECVQRAVQIVRSSVN